MFSPLAHLSSSITVIPHIAIALLGIQTMKKTNSMACLTLGSFLCKARSAAAMRGVAAWQSAVVSDTCRANGIVPNGLLRRSSGSGNSQFSTIRCRIPRVIPFGLQNKRVFDDLHNSQKFALFGSRAGVDGNPAGNIDIFNEQNSISDIDQEALRETIRRIGQIIGYETYDVTLLLVEDDEMRETNLETRNIDAPTDILSFPFLSHEEAGTLSDPPFDYPDFYNLGDMMVDVPYVMRRCEEDRQIEEGEHSNEEDEEDDRGVSGAMATVYDPEKRIHMLMVHGMLHLVGHDHEEDEEYELMVAKEEEILKELGLMP